MPLSLADDELVSEPIPSSTIGSPAKRVQRTAEEKRRIVEATLVPGASIARVARENGVNANQVFQWRYEYRNGAGWAARRPGTELLPVTIAAERSSIAVQELVSVPSASSASIHIELPGRALVTVEGGIDAELVRTVLGSLLR